MSQSWMIAYDVSKDRARAELAGILEARGPRVLYSVFEIETVDIESVVERVAAKLGPRDLLVGIRFCDRCTRWRFGQPIEEDADRRRALVLD